MQIASPQIDHIFIFAIKLSSLEANGTDRKKGRMLSLIALDTCTSTRPWICVLCTYLYICESGLGTITKVDIILALTLHGALSYMIRLILGPFFPPKNNPVHQRLSPGLPWPTTTLPRPNTGHKPA